MFLTHLAFDLSGVVAVGSNVGVVVAAVADAAVVTLADVDAIGKPNFWRFKQLLY